MAFSSVVNLGAAPSGGYLVAQPVSTVETAAANPTATVLRPMSTTVGTSIDSATLSALTPLVGASLTGVFVPQVPTVGAYTYDGSGRVLTDPDGNTYTYNADNTVHTITKAGVTRTFTYNGDGTIASVA